jgi:hypothetical protein
LFSTYFGPLGKNKNILHSIFCKFYILQVLHFASSTFCKFYILQVLHFASSTFCKFFILQVLHFTSSTKVHFLKSSLPSSQVTSPELAFDKVNPIEFAACKL